MNLWPLSQAEISGGLACVVDQLLVGEVPQVVGAPKGRAASADPIVDGGFPDALERTPRQRARYFRSYVQTVLGRDLGEIGEVRVDRAGLEQSLRLLAHRSGGLANYSALARDLALDDKTVKAHLALLQQPFLVRRLAPWSTKLGARQVKTPKLVICDSGMAAALIGAASARYGAPDKGALAGMLLESFVVMELVKQLTWSENTVEVFFYRDTGKREVDVVIESAAGDVVAVGQSSSERIRVRCARPAPAARQARQPLQGRRRRLPR